MKKIKIKIRSFGYRQISKFLYFFIKNNYINEVKNYDFDAKYKRIYHYHIRKTGGTSLNKMFLSSLSNNTKNDIYINLNNSYLHLTKENNKIFVGWNKFLIEKGIYHYSFSHIPQHELKLPKETFTVTVLRDPIERLLSHYNMLKDYKEKGCNHSCMEIEGKWLGENFDQFLDNIPKEHLLRQLYMFSKKYDKQEAFQNITNCSCYFFTEEFEKGVCELNELLGLDLKNTVREKKAIKKVIPTKAEIQKMQRLLKPEIELIGELKKFKYSE